MIHQYIHEQNTMEYKNDTPISVDGIVFDIKENVKSISTSLTDSSKNIILYEKPLNKTQDDINIYFILETTVHAAFSHCSIDTLDHWILI